MHDHARSGQRFHLRDTLAAMTQRNMDRRTFVLGTAATAAVLSTAQLSFAAQSDLDLSRQIIKLRL